MEQTDKPEKSRTPAHPYIRSDRVEGTAVYAADGSRIGTIKYLEIEKVSGQIIYAITSFNAFLAVRADTHTIPWSKLKYDPQLHDYRTDITQEQLHNTPEFSRGDEFDWHKPEKSRTPTHPYVRSDRVEGTAVYAADGSRIGTIKYLEIEKVSGQIIYAITSFNAFLAVRADTHTIPWSKLKYDPQLHGYRTDITQEQLHNAPEFSRGDEFDWPEHERERLHRYWHSPPYGGM